MEILFMKQFKNFDEMNLREEQIKEALDAVPQHLRSMLKEQVAIEKRVLSNKDNHTIQEVAKAHETLIDIAERIDILTDSYIESKQLQKDLEATYYWK